MNGTAPTAIGATHLKGAPQMLKKIIPPKPVENTYVNNPDLDPAPSGAGVWFWISTVYMVAVVALAVTAVVVVTS